MNKRIVDIIIVIGLLLVIFVGIITAKHMRATASKQIEATSQIEFDVFLRMNNPKLLVLNKRDILPPNISDEKLLNSIDGNYIDKVLVSSKTNYNFDLLISKIRDYRTSNKVYLLGYTNAGKSSIVNKLLYHYGKKESKIVTSMLPSTTLNFALFLER